MLCLRLPLLLLRRLHDVSLVGHLSPGIAIHVSIQTTKGFNATDRLLNYTPPAVVIRLLTTNGLIAYLTSWVLYLSGASSDPRLLLPAWISITTVGPHCLYGKEKNCPTQASLTKGDVQHNRL